MELKPPRIFFYVSIIQCLDTFLSAWLACVNTLLLSGFGCSTGQSPLLNLGVSINSILKGSRSQGTRRLASFALMLSLVRRLDPGFFWKGRELSFLRRGGSFLVMGFCFLILGFLKWLERLGVVVGVCLGFQAFKGRPCRIIASLFGCYLFLEQLGTIV